MTMTINVTPAGLTQAQREAVAGFILAYPGAECAGSCRTEQAGVTAEVHDNVELAALDRDSKIPTPPVDLSGAEAGAAFAVLPVPLAPGDRIPASTPAGNVPPPPAATAPITTTPGPVSLAAPAPPVGSVDLDKNGLPWDARIHAESKAKVADGSWRMKRNLDPAVKATVEAELRQVMGAPAAPLVAPIATIPAHAAPVGASSPTITASPVAVVSHLAPVPQPAPVGSMAAFGQAVAADSRQTFVALVGRSAAAMAAGKLTQQEVTDCCLQAGVPMLPLLANRLDLVPGVAAVIDAIIASRP